MSMAHDCRNILCDTPHHDNDSHPEACICEVCHPEHIWQQWEVYPGNECAGCETMLFEWLKENVDEPMCACGSFRIYLRGFCCWCFPTGTEIVPRSA